MPRLESFDVSNNQLIALPAALFDGLPRLEGFDVSNNQLIALPPKLFAGLPLEWLSLNGNGLTNLPPGLFEGVTELEALDLSDNPGAPFALTLELVASPATDSSPGDSAAVVAEVASGVPFDVQSGVSAAGGALSASTTLIEAGQIRGGLLSVAPQGDGPVTVELEAVSGVLKEWRCDNIYTREVALGQRCYRGVRTAAGAPLVLYGLADRKLAPEGAVKFHLASAFPNLAEGASYAVELSNPVAVEATVREGLLIVSATNGGETEVAVTATGADGRRETRRFTVTAEQPVANSLWGGWRSALLRPPPAAGGDGS